MQDARAKSDCCGSVARTWRVRNRNDNNTTFTLNISSACRCSTYSFHSVVVVVAQLRFLWNRRIARARACVSLSEMQFETHIMQIEVSQRRFRVLFVFFLLFLFHATTKKEKIYCALFSSKFRKIKIYMYIHKMASYCSFSFHIVGIFRIWKRFYLNSFFFVFFLFHSLRP